MDNQLRFNALRLLAAVGLWALLTMAGCSSDDPVNPGESEPPLTFEIDLELEPPVDSLPGFEDGVPRPVGSIVNSDGLQANFVANELWVSSNDEAAIGALITELSAVVIAEIDPSDYDLSGLPRQTLLRFTPEALSASETILALEEVSLEGSGEHRVSSPEDLGLFTVAANATLGGVDVGINWIGENSSMTTRETEEAPSGPPGYTTNAFEWASHSTGSSQGIGVAEAWRGLELAGKTSNKVKLAILDLGFQVNNDTPSDWEAFSNVPFMDPLNQPNFIGCGGGSSCFWHGTNVLSSAMAVPDDEFGGAGPAGQIATPIIISTSYDFFTSIGALLQARSMGAKIANMSYGAPVPTILAFSVYPFEATTLLLAETGMLLFASAGNDGENVDDESCFLGICVENTWWTPCENAGVICVGGLQEDTKNKAGNSNYGSEHVDIFAPYTLYVGPDPDNTGNIVRKVNGTSFSSPFTAGVAAMIWAADPELSADEVLEILYDTAHSSNDERVNRYVNALGAVQTAIGNAAPVITVFGGTDITRQLNHEITLSAQVTDFEDGNNCCDITWESSVDGDLGTGNSITHAFTTVGTRTITLRSTDADGATGAEVITLTIENTAPSVTITRPTPGETVFAGSPVILRGTAFDTNEPDQDIACSSMTWRSSLAGDDEFPLTGCETEATFSTLGLRTVSLTATDPQGLSTTESVTVVVVEPPNNLPPAVSVTSPENGMDIGFFDVLNFSGNATDPEGNTPLSYEWIVNFGEGDVVVGNTPSMTWTPEDSMEFECDRTWDIRITLRVTDSLGRPGNDFVDVRAIVICK